MQIDFFNNEFPLLVFLRMFVGLDVGPSDVLIASFAMNVGYGMKAGHEGAVFGGAGRDVDALVEEVGSSFFCLFECNDWRRM